MKKLFILILLMISMFFCACTGCSNKSENIVANDSIDSLVIEDTVLVDTLQQKRSIKWSVKISIDTIGNNVVVKNPVVKM
jgi:uncharacterized protein YcfL